MAEYLDEAKVRREPPEEPEARALGSSRRIRLVPEIGVLGVRRDLGVSDRGPGGTEGLLANLLPELVEAVAHA